MVQLILGEKSLKKELEEAFMAGLYLGLTVTFQTQLKKFVREIPKMSNKHLQQVLFTK